MNSAFLESLAPRIPGQSIGDVLVERLVEQADPPVAEALQAAAIPTTFDAGLLGALIGSPAEAPGLLRALVKDYTFINPTNERYAYQESARRAIRAKLQREDPATFRRLNGVAARYFLDEAGRLAPGETHDAAVRSAMYQFLASDDQDRQRGYDMLLELFASAEADYRMGAAYIVVRLASEQRAYLNPEQQIGLAWLEGRLQRLQGQPDTAAATLENALKSNLPRELLGRIELSLAQALGDDNQWAGAISHARAARKTFGLAHQTQDEASALVELARAYAGLARSVRGSRAVRPPSRNWFLNLFYQAGILVERLPILVYLMIWLDAGRLLTVLPRLARDQDWVIARLFVKAARCLYRVGLQLGKGSRRPRPTDKQVELLWIEARRARATLYRTLGHPAYAVRILADLLEHPLVQENAYWMARVRLELADTLLDASSDALAIEELRAALPVFESLQDLPSQARARLLMGQAIVSAAHDRPALRSDRLVAGVEELVQSLGFYTQLQESEARAEVARILDKVATDARLPSDHPAVISAAQAAAGVHERRFPVRYQHPRIWWFRVLSLIALTLTFIIILFRSVQIQSGTWIGATAIIGSRPLQQPSSDFVPAVTVTLPEQQLGPHFVVRYAVAQSTAAILVYVVLYIVAGLTLVSTSSPNTQSEAQDSARSPDMHREAQAQVVVVDDQGIRLCGSGDPVELKWSAVQEAIQINRCVHERPIAGFSDLTLFGDGVAVQIPGRATEYEDRLTQQITARLPVQPRKLGYSMLLSWAGLLFLLTLGAQVVFIVLGEINANFAIRRVLGPYSLSDLFIYTFAGLLVPLVWWVVVNPLVETLTLEPTSRWPLWMGAIGLAVEVVILLVPGRWLARMPHPYIFPILLCAFLVAASAAFIVAARHWKGRPSIRTEHVHPLRVRAAAIIIAILALAAGLTFTAREVSAYHELARGNEARDLAGRTGDPALKQQAIEHYTASADLLPDIPAAYASRGMVYMLQDKDPPTEQDYLRAISDLNKAIERDPGQPMLYANRGLANHSIALSLLPHLDRDIYTQPTRVISPDAANYLNLALADYRSAQKIDPKDPDYHVKAGAVLYDQERFEEAIGEYTRTLELDPHNAEAYAGRGWSNFRIGLQNEQADRLSQATPYYVLAWSDFMRTQELLSAEADRLAPEDRERARLNLRLANAYSGQAWMAWKFRRYSLSADLFEEASKLEPDNAQYLISLGNVAWLGSKGQASDSAAYRELIERAVKAYERAAGLPSDDRVRAYWFRTIGQFHYLQASLQGHDYRQELEQAIASDDEAIKLDAGSPEYFLRRGEIRRELARSLRADDWPTSIQLYTDAIEDLQHVQVEGSNSPYLAEAKSTLVAAYNQLGWGYHLNKQDALAASLTQKALEIDPKNALASLNLAVLRLYLGDVEQARRDYAAAIQVTQSDSNKTARYYDAIVDLNALKQDRPEMSSIADEMLALIVQACQP